MKTDLLELCVTGPPVGVDNSETRSTT